LKKFEKSWKCEIVDLSLVKEQKSIFKSSFKTNKSKFKTQNTNQENTKHKSRKHKTQNTKQNNENTYILILDIHIERF
jgi:hypothetical protein